MQTPPRPTSKSGPHLEWAPRKNPNSPETFYCSPMSEYRTFYFSPDIQPHKLCWADFSISPSPLVYTPPDPPYLRLPDAEIPCDGKDFLTSRMCVECKKSFLGRYNDDTCDHCLW